MPHNILLSYPATNLSIFFIYECKIIAKYKIFNIANAKRRLSNEVISLPYRGFSFNEIILQLNFSFFIP
ncbi:MAG: hypothetical protein EA412_05505 [Chitinophagaceae bacterium]|nr:MAG: hypothetical protein EA412_05505 [Chitinophagaceae bacterium]